MTDIQTLAAKKQELENCREAFQAAADKKQAVHEQLCDIIKRTNEAYDNMQALWDERITARERQNCEYLALQRATNRRNEVWQGYDQIRDHNNAKIAILCEEADQEHQAMIDCAQRAGKAYEMQDHAAAAVYAQRKREHKKRRDELNVEVSTLGQEVKNAKIRVQKIAPNVDTAAYYAAKENFLAIKKSHEVATAEFKALKAERRRLQEEFETCKANYVACKELLVEKNAEFSELKSDFRDQALDCANVYSFDRENAKVVQKSDGTTQVYYGGLEDGDGLGHGHVVIDSQGKITYDRPVFGTHGGQNFIDSES